MYAEKKKKITHIYICYSFLLITQFVCMITDPGRMREVREVIYFNSLSPKRAVFSRYILSFLASAGLKSPHRGPMRIQQVSKYSWLMFLYISFFVKIFIFLTSSVSLPI